MANRIRKKKITFYFDDDEYDVMRTKMRKMDINNMSLYLRKMALEGRIIQVDYSAFDKMAEALSGVSRNINQIAKRINATDNIYADDIRQIKKSQEDLWQLLKSVESQLL